MLSNLTQITNIYYRYISSEETSKKSINNIEIITKIFIEILLMKFREIFYNYQFFLISVT